MARLSSSRMGPVRSATLRDAFDRMFGESLLGKTLFPGRAASRFGGDQWIPVNMFDLPEGIMVVAPMPGLQADDVELTVMGNVLTLHGRRRRGKTTVSTRLRSGITDPTGVQ